MQSFREQERDILLNVPGESRPEMGDEELDSHIASTRNEKWWWGAAHMRHHLEFLLVLKGMKPCVLFVRHTIDNAAIFSTIVLDSLVPIMDRLGLWSYGFRLGFREGEWVLYDSRSPKRSQVEKIFLTPKFVRELDQSGAFAAKDKMYYVPNLEVAHALGYPILSDAMQSDNEPSWIQIRDVTEMDELEQLGRPPPLCCVQGMIYCCPDAGAAGEADWKEVLAHFHRCEAVADDMETQLGLCTLWHKGLNTWLKENPGWLCRRSSGIAFSGPRLFSHMGMRFGGDDLDFEDDDQDSEDDDLDSEDDDLEDDDEHPEDEHPHVEGYDLD